MRLRHCEKAIYQMNFHVELKRWNCRACKDFRRFINYTRTPGAVCGIGKRLKDKIIGFLQKAYCVKTKIAKNTDRFWKIKLRLRVGLGTENGPQWESGRYER
jgi:hypothetical protein